MPSWHVDSRISDRARPETCVLGSLKRVCRAQLKSLLSTLDFPHWGPFNGAPRSSDQVT